jgi:hypothetical protein
MRELIAAASNLKKISKKESLEDYLVRITHCDLGNKKLQTLVKSRVSSLGWIRKLQNADGFIFVR